VVVLKSPVDEWRHSKEEPVTSQRQTFWERDSFALVGHTGKRPFPKLTYNALKRSGKTVYAVDPSIDEIDGDRTFADLDALPAPVEAVVLELPKEETAAWVARVADAGIKAVWIHQRTDTPAALELASRRGLEVCAGTCAVMYVTPGLSAHSPHRWIRRALGKY
jgi:predicted CoA-binding protein